MLLIVLSAGYQTSPVCAYVGTESVTVPDTMLRELPDGFRPFCTWETTPGGAPDAVDRDDLAEAVELSGKWIRAVFQETHVPDDIEKRIVGVVEHINGYDVTRVEFETKEFRFLVTQTASTMYVLIAPASNGAERPWQAPLDIELYLRATIENVFRHPAVILYLQRMEQTGFGVRMVMDERAGHEEAYGLPADADEHVRPSKWPSPTEESRKSFEVRDAKVRELDSTLPEEFSRHGGARLYWWGRVYAATDGRVVVFIAGKGDPGAGRKSTGVLKDWFRKEKAVRPDGRRARAPLPPLDRSGP
jgi:hypothetical protein